MFAYVQVCLVLCALYFCMASFGISVAGLLTLHTDYTSDRILPAYSELNMRREHNKYLIFGCPQRSLLGSFVTYTLRSINLTFSQIISKLPQSAHVNVVSRTVKIVVKQHLIIPRCERHRPLLLIRSLNTCILSGCSHRSSFFFCKSKNLSFDQVLVSLFSQYVLLKFNLRRTFVGIKLFPTRSGLCRPSCSLLHEVFSRMQEA